MCNWTVYSNMNNSLTTTLDMQEVCMDLFSEKLLNCISHFPSFVGAGSPCYVVSWDHKNATYKKIPVK